MTIDASDLEGRVVRDLDVVHHRAAVALEDQRNDARDPQESDVSELGYSLAALARHALAARADGADTTAHCFLETGCAHRGFFV